MIYSPLVILNPALVHKSWINSVKNLVPFCHCEESYDEAISSWCLPRPCVQGRGHCEESYDEAISSWCLPRLACKSGVIARLCEAISNLPLLSLRAPPLRARAGSLRGCRRQSPWQSPIVSAPHQYFGAGVIRGKRKEVLC